MRSRIAERGTMMNAQRGTSHTSEIWSIKKYETSIIAGEQGTGRRGKFHPNLSPHLKKDKMELEHLARLWGKVDLI